jgi:hypothetical protein
VVEAVYNQEVAMSDTPELSDSPVPFFLVGTRKLIVLSIATLGLYEAYWFYRHWQQLRRVGGEDVWPIPRTFFAGLFSYSLFSRVTQEADSQGAPSLFSPLLLAFVYFAALMSSRLGAAPWLVIGVSLVPLALTQVIVNGLPQVQALPRAARNERLSKKNWGGIVVFALLCLVLLLPEPDAGTVPTGDVSIPSLADEMNRDLPRTMSGGVTLDRVEWAMNGVGLYVRVTQLTEKELVPTTVVDTVRRTLLQMACASAGLEGIALDRGIPLRYTIGDTHGSRVALMELTSRAQCAAATP